MAGDGTWEYPDIPTDEDPWTKRLREGGLLPPKPAPKPKTVVSQSTPGDRVTAYAEGGLRAEAAAIAATNEHTRNRNTTLFTAAAALRRYIRAGVLTEARVTGELSAAAAGTGLSDREIADAIKNGYRRDDDQHGHEPLAIPDGGDYVREAYQLDAPPTDTEAGAIEEVDVLAGMRSGAWLDRQVFAPLEYVVPGIVPEGASLLSAPPKVGKSWFALFLALMIALGGTFLGQQVPRRPVLYLALEDGHRRLQERARTLLGEGQPIPEWFHYMLVVDPRAAAAVVVEFLGRYPDEKPLVIVDTLGRIKPQKRGGDESYLSDYHFAAGLKAAIDTRPGSALLAIHHTRKAESEDFVEAGSGTLGLAGAFDTVLVIRRKRHEQTGTLFVTGRDVEEGRYALRVDDGHWRLDGATLIDAADAADERAAQPEVSRFSERTHEVLGVVQQRGQEGLVTTAQDVAEQITITPKRATEVLRRLADGGAITRTGRGVYTTKGPSDAR